MYYIYKTTNRVNNKIYVGIHKSNDIEYECEFDAYKKEAEIVDEIFIARLDTYNINVGGHGSWKYVNVNNVFNSSYPGFVESRQLGARKTEIGGSNLKKSDFAKYCKLKHFTDEVRLKISNSVKLYQSVNGSGGLNKNHSEETKNKMSKSAKGKHIGKLNSQYGTCGIYNSKTRKNKKIPKENLSNGISIGGVKGRKIKRDD